MSSALKDTQYAAANYAEPFSCQNLDLDSVLRFDDQSPDYWGLAKQQKLGPEKATDFFIDTTPNYDLNRSFRAGLF